MTDAELLSWLTETEPARLEVLWARADAARREGVGDAVHLRGLVEASNHCVRSCAYCGIGTHNAALPRYRMSAEEILGCARQAVGLGYWTLVIQAGEDYGLTRAFISEVVRAVKTETPLAVTLSLGERTEEDLASWRQAGADRYLLRFETSDAALYEKIHPSLPGKPSDRLALLHRLRACGYEIGSGVMIGIPGQTFESLARDVATFAELDLDMIGVGPFIPHPVTPLGRRGIGAETGGQGDAMRGQVPATEEMTYKVLALSRLVCPQANIPSTTALATLNRASGRELGLARGANVVMPNLTPGRYRVLYEIYPAKACIHETAQECAGCLQARIEGMGRTVGRGPGGRRDQSID